MANTFHGGGSQSPTSLSKPIEKVFEDAQHTGEIQLNCRKLREYPKLAGKYDLVDTISADLSKNRLSEVPKEICAYLSLEKIQCYHNVIKSIPEAIVQLQALTYLNLSRNQLSIIPSFISQLQTLEVLIASHNRLVSLPEEIGVLDKLMELDVSCNEISHLPIQIGDLKSLKSLNVRRNLLEILPVEISKLNLRKLDISGNRISKIPTVFRRIETLEDIILHDNPLTMPPAHVCTKGKQHIMKYLQIIANREDKQRGMLNEAEMKRFRKSLPPQQTVSSEEFRNLMESPDKWKRHTVLSSDSGYSTTDSIDKISWSPQEELQRQKADYENKKKAAEQIRIQQEEEEEREQRRRAAQRIQDEQRAMLERQREETRLLEEKRAQEEARQREAEEAKRQEELRLAEEARKAEEMKKAEENRRLEEERAQLEAKQHRAENNDYPKPKVSKLAAIFDKTNRKPALSASNSFKEERRPGSGTQYRRTTSDSNQRLPAHVQQSGSQPPTSTIITNGPIMEQPSVNGSGPTTPVSASPKTSFSSQSNPAPRSDPVTNGPTGDRAPSAPGTASRKPKTTDKVAPATTSRVAKPTDKHGRATTATSTKTGVPTARKSNLNQDEELRKSTQSLKSVDGTTKTRGEQRLRTIQKEAVNNYMNRRSSGSTSSEDDRKRSTPTRTGLPSSTTTSKRAGTVMTNAQVKMLEDYNKDSNPNFTMRRHHDSYRDHSEQMDILRKTISTRLKRSLPDSLSEALSDGVLLCHLANQIRPRSVASVHVPSPAVPKLTPAKCRRNVENFLEACRKIGVSESQICGASDILEEKGLNRVASTVAALVAIATNPKHTPATNV